MDWAKIILAIAVAGIIAVFIAVVFLPDPSGCMRKESDVNGFLFKICKYVRDTNLPISPANAEDYEIEWVQNGDYNGRPVWIVRLNCCYMGDYAYIDRETSNIIRFDLGDM